MNFEDYRQALAGFYKECGVDLRLENPAPSTTLDAAEGALGFVLDTDLRSAWLSANGSPEWEAVFSNPGYESTYKFLSVAEALQQRTNMEARSPRYADYVQEAPRSEKIQSGWFQKGWLPFASFGGATLLLIQDYSPSSAGQPGQIISFTHDPDSINYVAPNFSVFLEGSIESLLQFDAEEFRSIIDR